MRTLTFHLFATMMIGSSLAVSLPAKVEAGAIPWTYNAIFGYGPIFPRRFGYTAGYSPMYSPANMWGGNYAPQYTTNYGPVMGWSSTVAPVTTYYGPSYYGGGAVYSGSNCGCNPCAVSVCDPCGGASGCATGNCSTSTGNYSPEPANTNSNDDADVTPTFKPTNPEKPVADPNDDFVPVERRENEYLAPRTNGSTIPSNTTPSTIPTTPNTVPNLGDSTSTIPNPGPNSNPTSTIPMSPTDRTVAPTNGSTIPGVENRSTIPNPGGSASPSSTIPNIPNSTIPSNPSSTIPSNPGSTIPTERPFPPRNSNPAPTEPSTIPSIPNTSVEPIEVEPSPIARLVVERKRVPMKAGYRFPVVSRITVPTDRVMEAGASNLAIR